MKVKLSDHFTFKNIFKMVIGPVLMIIFSSLYSIVDGIYISNYVGKTAFAAVNLIFPVIMIVGGLGFMFGTGGAALTSKLLGEGKKEDANNTFSMVVLTSIITGLVFTLLLIFLIPPITRGLASFNKENSEEIIKIAIQYGRIMAIGETFFIMQNMFQSFFSVNEKSILGFYFTLASGLTNILLDFIFVGVLSLGVVGAAVASISAMFIGAVGPFIYFLVYKKGLIYIWKPIYKFSSMFKVCTNGCSEFFTNIANSVVSIVFNTQLLKYIGEDGVATYGILMYIGYVFIAIFIGYSIGITPVIGFNYGAKNKNELTNVLRKSFLIIGITGILMTLISEIFAKEITYIFANSSTELHELAIRATRIYSLIYLVNGFSIFGSSFFTALNNGLISAIISLTRALVLQIAAVYIFPLFMGIDGIWWAVVFAEIGSIIMTILFIVLNKKKYGYSVFFLNKNS